MIWQNKSKKRNVEQMELFCKRLLFFLHELLGIIFCPQCRRVKPQIANPYTRAYRRIVVDWRCHLLYTVDEGIETFLILFYKFIFQHER